MQCDERTADTYAPAILHLSDEPERLKQRASTRSPRSMRWQLVIFGCTIATVLVVAAWHAGHESGGLEEQRLSAELNRLAQRLSYTNLELQQQRIRADGFEKELTTQGRASVVKQQDQLRQQLLKAQAEANEYKQILGRAEGSTTENDRLIDLLSEPGVKLVPLQATDAAPGSTAYVIIAENSKLFFIASNLPLLANGNAFQLWLIRSQNPKCVNAGVFRPDDSKRILLEFENSAALSDITGIEVTEEPERGSESPMGAKVFESGQAPAHDAAPRTEDANEGDPLAGPSPLFRNRGILQ